MTIKRVTVAQHERALVWKNKTFAGVLEPGKQWLFEPFGDVEIQFYDLTVPEFEHPARRLPGEGSPGDPCKSTATLSS